MSSNIRVAVVGVGRNVEKTIEKEYLRYFRLLSDLDFVAMYIVESDSNDKSGAVLDSLKKRYQNFNFVQLGQLADLYIERIDRIRFCRNRYIEEIRRSEILRTTDYVLVVDLDNINNALTASALHKAINRNTFEWAAIFPNQFFNYYDLIALRCTNWLGTDFNKLVNRAYSISMIRHKGHSYLGHLRFELIRQKYFKRKCLRIPRNLEPFNVSSAFGGMGIYRTDLLLECDYGISKNVGTNECEHVELHRQAIRKGFKLFINPDLINNIVSKHTFRKSLICRLTIAIFRKIGIND